MVGLNLAFISVLMMLLCHHTHSIGLHILSPIIGSIIVIYFGKQHHQSNSMPMMDKRHREREKEERKKERKIY